jgi:XTP/dITP diphosphohydrolase
MSATIEAAARPPLLLATGNPGKFGELRALLSGLPLRLVSLEALPNAPTVLEDGDSYFANACLKATTIARWSGWVTLADDSGLEVDALNGAPGVRSARYAGGEQDTEANVRRLLAALAGVPWPARTARFRCVIVVAAPAGATLTVEGTCEGHILEAPRGRAGFGYDPVFFYPPAERSFAELTAAEKDRVSHRGRACAAIRGRLMAFVNAHPGRRPESVVD